MLIENVYGTREFQCNAKFSEGADSARDLHRITVLSLLAPPLPSPPHEGVHSGAREPKAVNTFTVNAEEVWKSDDGLPC